MMRNTRQRQAILEVVERSHDHPTAAQVYERVRVAEPGVGFATVYRNLRTLADEGKISEIRSGEVSQYDRRTERHDHAICQRCGKLVDLMVSLPMDVLENAAQASGFRVSGYHTEVFGLCPDCQ
jgi:Fe2+ or Zn2+ uptake regulation protein